MLPNKHQMELLTASPLRESSGALNDEEFPWLLPEIIGDIKVAAISGVLEFQVGVPIECCFDDVETRVAGVEVKPRFLKPGLHNVCLHFYDLVRNSIIFGELRLIGATLTHALPFRLSVGEIEQTSFSHAQVFSEEEQQPWRNEINTVGGTVWTKLGQNFMASLPELDRRIRQRPCKRKDLEILEQDFDRNLEMLRNKREQLRIREAFLPDPPNLLEAIHRIRFVLRHSYTQYDEALSMIRQVRELVERGHINRAVSEAAEIHSKVSEFNDLDLGFVTEAAHQHNRKRRRLMLVAIILVAGIFLTVLILRLFGHINPF